MSQHLTVAPDPGRQGRVSDWNQAESAGSGLGGGLAEAGRAASKAPSAHRIQKRPGRTIMSRPPIPATMGQTAQKAKPALNESGGDASPARCRTPRSPLG